MAEGHEERIREAFTRQAGTFEDERLNIAFTAGLPWLLAYVDPRPDDVVLTSRPAPASSEARWRPT